MMRFVISRLSLAPERPRSPRANLSAAGTLVVCTHCLVPFANRALPRKRGGRKHRKADVEGGHPRNQYEEDPGGHAVALSQDTRMRRTRNREDNSSRTGRAPFAEERLSEGGIFPASDPSARRMVGQAPRRSIAERLPPVSARWVPETHELAEEEPAVRGSRCASRAPPAPAMIVGATTTSRRRSPPSYLATKGCGRPSFSATCSWVMPFALRSDISWARNRWWRGDRRDLGM